MSAACSESARHSTHRGTQRTTSGSSRRLRSASGSTGRRDGTLGVGRAPARLADARRDELRAPRGARWDPVAVLRRGAPRDAVPARAAVGGRPREARPESALQRDAVRAAGRRAHGRVPAAAHDWPPAGFLQHRSADEWLRRRSGAARASTSRPRTRNGSGSRRGGRAGELAAWVARDAGPYRPRPPAGTRVHDAALPRPGRDQRAHDRRHRPEIGHGGVQGERGPDRSSPSRWGPSPLVDLVLPDALPTDDERSAVDAVLGPPSSGWTGGVRTIEADGRVARGGHDAREQRHLLLPALHALQSSAGWISPGGLRYVCERLTVPPAEAYGVATFYAMFSTDPRPPSVLHLCDDIACRVRGAEALISDVQVELGPEGRIGSPRPCLGLCDVAPAALLQTLGESYDPQIPNASMEVLGPFVRGETSFGFEGHVGKAVSRAAGNPACCGRSVSSIRPRSTTTARTVGTRRSARRSSSAPRARSASSRTRSCWAAAALPSPPA